MKPGWKLINRQPGKFFSGAVVLLSFIVAIGPSGLAWGQLSDEGSREIEIFKQQKTRGEDFARILKKSYEKKKISEQSLQKGEALYNDARVALNGYLTRFQFDIKAGRQPSQENLQVAVEKSEKFTAYADELVYGGSRGPVVVAVIAGIVTALSKAGIEFWKEYRKASQQERDVLAEDLKKLEWQPFDQIK
jgi:hypothetical protein